MNEPILTFRGREVYESDVAFIRQLISDHPDLSRWKLSFKLCEAWDWRQPNGNPKDQVCRSLMLKLHRAGHIELPPTRKKIHNRLAHRQKPVEVKVENQTEISIPMKALRQSGDLMTRQVRRTKEEKLFNSLIENYHYLGYTLPVGENLKYLVTYQGRPLACLAWSSAPRHIGARDRFIGWDQPARKRGIHLLAYNTRYLILPWVKIPHLASYLLGQMAKRISDDWTGIYHHPIYFLETFVDPELYRGTCYKAAGWIKLGKTLGLGKDNQDGIQNRSIKEILGKPLCRDFRQKLLQPGVS